MSCKKVELTRNDDDIKMFAYHNWKSGYKLSALTQIRDKRENYTKNQKISFSYKLSAKLSIEEETPRRVDSSVWNENF